MYNMYAEIQDGVDATSATVRQKLYLGFKERFLPIQGRAFLMVVVLFVNENDFCYYIQSTLVVVLFVNENDFCYYRNCLYNHRYKFSSEKEQVKESPTSI